MKSVLGASAALENLVRLMPAEAHLDGPTRDVPVTDLQRGDRVLSAIAAWSETRIPMNRSSGCLSLDLPA